MEMKWFYTTITIANLRLYVEVSGESREAAKQKLVDIIDHIRRDKLPVIIGQYVPCTKEDE